MGFPRAVHTVLRHDVTVSNFTDSTVHATQNLFVDFFYGQVSQPSNLRPVHCGSFCCLIYHCLQNIMCEASMLHQSINIERFTIDHDKRKVKLVFLVQNSTFLSQAH